MYVKKSCEYGHEERHSYHSFDFRIFSSSFCSIHFRDLLEESPDQHRCQEEAADIGYALAPYQAREAEVPRQHHQGGDQEKAAAAGCHQHGAHCMPGGLEAHVGQDGQGHQEKGHGLGPEGSSPYGNHQRIIPEFFQDGGGPKNGHGSGCQGKQGPRFHREPEAFPEPSVLFGPIAESAHWLESLAKADDHGGSKEAEPGHDGHGRDGGIPEGTGCYVEENSGKALGPLAHQGRRSPSHDFFRNGPGRMDVPQPDGDVSTPPGHGEQDAEADELAQNGSISRSRYAHMEFEDEERIQEHIQEAPHGDAHHPEGRTALEPEMVVHHQTAHHHRSPDKDHAHILDGIGQDGRGGPDQGGQLGRKGVAKNGNAEPA